MSDWEPQDGITGTGGGGPDAVVRPETKTQKKAADMTTKTPSPLRLVHDEPPAHVLEGPPPEDYGFEPERPLHKEIKTKLKTTIDAKHAALDGLPLIRAGAKNDGAPKPLMANVVTLLRHEAEFFNLRFDEFSLRSYRGDAKLTDDDFLDITNWVQRSGIHAEMRAVTQAVTLVSQDQRYHQVRDYLEPLVWDQIPRLAKLLVDNGGAKDTIGTQQATLRWFIQAVARVMRPGCQADATLILEGPQGFRKSSFFEAVASPWYVSGLSDLTSKDALQELRGVWVIEMAELNTLRRAEANSIKAFLTRKADHYRESYARITSDVPRQCVFAGTINPGPDGWQKDETGGRRFWPIKVTESINIENILSIKDQLWAEAVYWFKKDHPWHMDTEELEAAMAAEMEQRVEGDEWDVPVEEFLNQARSRDPDYVTSKEVFAGALNITEYAKIGKAEQMRMGKCMHRLRWLRKVIRDGGGGNRTIRAWVKRSDEHLL